MNYPKTEIKNLTDTLTEGKIILYPTDTIWGLGCDAENKAAIERIYAIKARPRDKHFLLLVSSLEMLKRYVNPIPPKASNLIQYYERPLTIIYDQALNIPSNLLAADGSIAIRVTKDPFCISFIEAFGRAIISTSANVSGEDFPCCFQEIALHIQQSADYIAQYRLEEATQEVGPSTIVRIDAKNELVFIRK